MLKSNRFGNGKNITKLLLPLDGNSRDFSGNGNNGSDSNMSYITDNGVRTAKFNDSNSYISVPNISDLTKNFTILLWAKFYSSKEEGLISKGLNGENKYQWSINTSAAGGNYEIFFNLDVDGTWGPTYQCDSNFRPDLNKWYLITATYDGSNMKIYINDIIKNTTPCTADAYNGNGNIYVGTFYDTSTYVFNGLIKGVLIEKRIWSQKDIALYFNSNKYKYGYNYYFPFKSPIIFLTTQIINFIAETGSFSLTGISASFHKYTKVIASVGSYTLTGISALFKRIVNFSASTGNFSLTGSDILFHRFINIVMGLGNFALTGIDAIIIKGKAIIMGVGNFTLTGSDILFHRLINITMSVGNFTLTGISALFHKSTKILLSLGSYTLTGYSILFHKVIRVFAVVGYYVFTGKDAILHKVKTITLSVGSYTLTGFSLLVHMVCVISLSTANFVVTGFSLIFKGFGNWLWRKQTKDDGEWTKIPKE